MNTSSEHLKPQPQKEQEDGPRLKHFRQAMQKMLQASLKQCTSSEKVDQTFPFNLAPAQLSRIEQCLAEEFTATSEIIKGSFEKTLESHELPPKLNQVDSVLRALPPNYQAEAKSDVHPEGLVKSSQIPAKLQMIQRLRDSIAQIQKENEEGEIENQQRQAVVDNRIGCVKAVRAKYIEAFNQTADISVGDLEAMIDRMAHQQTVPVKPL